MNQVLRVTAVAPAAFNHKEAARYIGMSSVTLWRKRDLYQVPSVRLPDGTIMYLREDLDAWLRSYRIESREDMAAQKDGRKS